MRADGGRRVALVVAAGLAVVILVITVTPSPVDRPFGAVVQQIVHVARDSLGMTWFTVQWLERLANVVMFVPFGLAAGMAFGRVRRWFAVPVALVLSAAVELVQYLALPERTGSPLDVLANTLGAALGVALSLLARPRERPPLD